MDQQDLDAAVMRGLVESVVPAGMWADISGALDRLNGVKWPLLAALFFGAICLFAWRKRRRREAELWTELARPVRPDPDEVHLLPGQNPWRGR